MNEGSKWKTSTSTPYRVVALLCGMIGLAGCGSEAGLIASSATGLYSFQATKKTTVDHVVGAIIGEDCSIIQFEKTGEYCHDPNAYIPIQPPVYCYNTLGDVECFAIPDARRQTPPLADAALSGTLAE